MRRIGIIVPVIGDCSDIQRVNTSKPQANINNVHIMFDEMASFTIIHLAICIQQKKVSSLNNLQRSVLTKHNFSKKCIKKRTQMY